MDILHIDDAIIVVNKPAGLPVLPDGWVSGAPYLVRMLEDAYGSSDAAPGQAIWIVHRIDKTTSGAIIFARTADAHRNLNAQFESHTAEKIYHAVITGSPTWEAMTARHPLRTNVGHKHRTAVDAKRGKPAETEFRVLHRFSGYSLLEARILTGRTHQIRAHAYAIGYPLLGDSLYGSTESRLIGRPALHAQSLTIIHPATGERQTFIAPYPVDFSELLERLNA